MPPISSDPNVLSSAFVLDSAHGKRDGNRVDGRDVEPRNGLHEDQSRLRQPLRWRAPRMIFVNSMSDLFHKDVPREFIARVCDTMERANWHTFQVLTKLTCPLKPG